MTLEWFPRVLGTKCGRYTVVANRTSAGWNYLPFCIENGISKPLCSAVDSAEKAQEKCDRHSRPPKQIAGHKESDAAQSSAGSATAVKAAFP